MGRNLDRGDLDSRNEKQRGTDNKSNSKSEKVKEQTKENLYKNLK